MAELLPGCLWFESLNGNMKLKLQMYENRCVSIFTCIFHCLSVQAPMYSFSTAISYVINVQCKIIA